MSSGKQEGIIQLHEACRQGNISQVKDLLKGGVNPELTDEDGNTALHCASATNQVAILQLLLSPPHSCIVDIRTCYDETPLHVACLNGHLDAAQLLVEKGADLCIRDGKGNTTLHLSAAGGSCKLIRWIMREKNCEGLLNAQNKDNDTPAHCAGRLGCLEAFTALRELRANFVTLCNKWHRTPSEEFSQYNYHIPTSKSALSDEKEEDNGRNNSGKSVHMRKRAQSEPRVASKGKKGEGGEQSGSQSTTNVTTTRHDGGATSNSYHNTCGADRGKNGVTALDSKSMPHIGTKQHQQDSAHTSKGTMNMETHATGTPREYRSKGKTGKYKFSSRVDELRGVPRDKPQSEKLPRRKSHGGERREAAASSPGTPVQMYRSQSDKRVSSQTLV